MNSLSFNFFCFSSLPFFFFFLSFFLCFFFFFSLGRTTVGFPCFLLGWWIPFLTFVLFFTPFSYLLFLYQNLSGTTKLQSNRVRRAFILAMVDQWRPQRWPWEFEIHEAWARGMVVHVREDGRGTGTEGRVKTWSELRSVMILERSTRIVSAS